MPHKSKQSGFVPILIIIFLAVVGGASALVITNASFNQSESAPKEEQQSTNSAQLEATPSPSISKAVTPTLSPKKTTSSPTPAASNKTTNSNTSSSNNSNSGSSNNTNSQTSTSTSAPASTPTPTTGSIKGTIKDSGGNSLANASFEITCSGCNKLRNGSTQGEQADSSGNFTVNNLPILTLSVKPFYGHWGEAKTVTVVGGQNTNVDLVVGANTTAKPTISITKGPYSGNGNSPCFDVSATHQNCHQLNAEYATNSDTFQSQTLSYGGCTYSATICTGRTGSHIFKVKAYTVSTNTSSDVVSSAYTYP